MFVTKFAASVAVVLFAASVGLAQNVMLNPGFEAPDASGGDVAGTTDWTTFESVFTTASEANTGTQSLKMFGPDFSKGASGAFQNHPAAPGETWGASGFVLDSSADPLTNIGIFQLNFLDSGGNDIGGSEVVVDSTLVDDVWTPLSVSAVAPAGTVEVQMFLLHIQIGEVTGGSVFWDDVVLENLPPSTNVILNGSFESPDASGGDVDGTDDWSSFESVFTTATQSNTGNQSLKMFGPFFPKGASGAFQNHPASPGQTWSASVFALDSTADPLTNIGIFQLNFLDSGGNGIGGDEVVVDSTLEDDVWTPLSVSAVAPAGTVEVQIFLLHIQIGDITGGSIFWDDVVLQQAGQLCADDGMLVEGFGEQNDFNATCGSDDVRWAAHGATFAFQITDPVSQFELSTTAATATPGTITVDLEASKENSNGNLNLRALLFNFDSGGYVALTGVMPLGTSDTMQTFELPGGADPTDFVDPGTLEVRLLIQTIQTSGQANNRTQLDEVLFGVN